MQGPVFIAASIAVILAMSIGGIAVPLSLRLTQSDWSRAFIAIAGQVTAGVFLGAGMIHMLPDALADAPHFESRLVNAFATPLVLFCVGFFVVWYIERIEVGGAQVPTLGEAAAQHKLKRAVKHRLLAVAQQARLHGLTASICFVDVPPVTTYHHAKQKFTGRLPWQEGGDAAAKLLASEALMLCYAML